MLCCDVVFCRHSARAFSRVRPSRITAHSSTIKAKDVDARGVDDLNPRRANANGRTNARTREHEIAQIAPIAQMRGDEVYEGSYTARTNG